ncbi:MAG: carboxypeptidase regulatory-like domain-containing protein [Parabacteroides sp.]|nr:carboxypeptidase regulatory-like domain-containing protein [Parabacteroides sp.]
MMKKHFGWLLCISCLLCNQQLWAQASTTGTVTGYVLDEEKEPVIGATVVVKNESTGFTTGTTTSLNGDYVLKQLPLGSPYTVKVSYIGYGDQTKSNYALNQGDVLRVDFRLSEKTVNIAEVQVVANSLKNKASTSGSSTAVSAKDIATLPVNGRNFTSLTDLSPLSSGSNIAGQLASSTSYTIDGMTAKSAYSSGTTNRGPYLVSMEAIREFEVVTNNYDVTLGRSGGGTISSVTKSGTNEFHGSAFAYERADFLSSKYDTRGNRKSDEYSISQFGVSLGGPVIKDRLHFFVAWDQQLDARPLLIGDIHSVNDEKLYGISQKNLNKFVDIARNQYGVSGAPQIGSFDKRRNSSSVFARVDWQINATNLLTLRNNYNRDMNNQGTNDNSTINLYEVYGSNLSTDNSLLASLRTVTGPRSTNELKVQYLYSMDHGTVNSLLPSANIPRAIVQNITSAIDGEEYKLASIQLGDQRYLPEKFKNNVLQVVDNFYLNTGRIDYTFGADLMYTHLNSLATSEMNGRFYYSGMEAFENNTPYRYAREIAVGDPTVTQDVMNGALYAQARVKLFAGADVTVGLRGDYTHYFANPNDNLLLRQELGLSTTHKVAAFQAQPRVQFTWDINDKHTDIIRAGGGIMGSNMNNYAMINNLLFDGLRVLSVDITSQNYAIPTADFVGYRQNPATAPGAELFDRLGIDKTGTFNINSKDLKMPTVYKYNFSYNRFFTDNLRAGIHFYGTHARNNYMYVDRNMADAPYFRLSNEANRGVYVPAESIDIQTGNTDWTQGKKSGRLGRVLELVSEGKVNTYALVADVTYRYFRDGEVSLSYTWNDSKDNTSYNGNVANSATLYRQVVDDPRDLSRMNYSDTQFRHKVVFYGNAPSFWGVNVGVRYSGIGGTRYSAVVNGNINGDFVSGNDLAYIFDADSPDTPAAVRDGLASLLADPDVEPSFKEYILKNKGRVAERNGGVNKFYGTWDIRVSKDFTVYKRQRLQLSVDLFNVANLFDKEKGLSHALGKQSLYTVTGFDPVSKTYRYKVNANAGKVTPSGNPWQLQIGLKYIF